MYIAAKRVRDGYDEAAGAYTYYEIGDAVPAEKWGWQIRAAYERTGHIKERPEPRTQEAESQSEPVHRGPGRPRRTA